MGEKKKVFVCTSHRPRQFGGGCCSDKGGDKIAAEFETCIRKARLSSKIEVVRVDCLRACKQGASVHVWPEQMRYAKVTVDSVYQIVDEHLVNGKPVESMAAQAISFLD